MLGFLNRRKVSVSLPCPPVNSLYLLNSSAALSFNLVTDPALLFQSICLHDQFHTTGLSSSVLAVAVLSEVAPFPVAAGETMLIEEAHVLEKRLQHGPVLFQMLTYCTVPVSDEIGLKKSPSADAVKVRRHMGSAALD